MLDRVLRPDPDHVVPLVWLGEGALFERICTHFGRLVEEGRVKAMRQGGLDEAGAFWGLVTGHEYRTSVYPFPLWEGQSPWFVLVVSATDGEQLTQAEAAIRSLNGMAMPGARPFVFLHGRDGELDWNELVARFSTLTTPLFLLDGDAGAGRSDEEVGLAIAGFVTSGWMSYCTRSTTNWRDALRINGDESVFSLGMAMDQPDWEYYRDAWRHSVHDHLVTAWSGLGPRIDWPGRSNATALVQAILPEAKYRTQANPDRDDPAVTIGETAAGCEFIEPPVPKEFRSSRDDATGISRIARLDRFYEMLQLGERPVAEGMMLRRAHAWERARKADVEKSLRMTADPPGLFVFVRSHLQHWIEYYSSIKKAGFRTPAGVPSMDQCRNRIRRWENRVPSAPSVALRLILIGLAVGWTVWGTFFWATGKHPWNDAGLARMLWHSAGALALLVMAALAHLAWTHYGLSRAEDRARHDVLTHFLADLLEQVHDHLTTSADAVRRHASVFSGDWDRLVSRLTKGENAGAVKTTRSANRNARFSDAAFNVLRDRSMPGLVLAAHRLVSENLMSDTRWPTFDHTVWVDAMNRAVNRLVDEEFTSIDYHAAVEADGWPVDRRQRLMAEMATDARKPLFAAAPDPNAHVTLFARLAWQETATRDQRVKANGRGMPYLLAVSAIPLRLIASRGRTEEA